MPFSSMFSTASAPSSGQSEAKEGASGSDSAPRPYSDRSLNTAANAIEVSYEEEDVTLADGDGGGYGEEEDDDDDEEEEDDDEEADDEEGEEEYEEFTVYDDETVRTNQRQVTQQVVAQEEEEEQDREARDRDRVALYNEGATPLFLQIEESNWRQALALVDEDSARTWVRSTGTMATTFEWSLWTRLPLHEACRRQAPAWFVSKLLRAHPGGARAPTQFGELPLHLAVECGSAPDVVNLLLVAHWPAIAAEDRSGRTPLDIARDAEHSPPSMTGEDVRVVMECLERCREAWDQAQADRARRLEEAEARHQASVRQILKRHEAELEEEFKQHSDLIEQVQHLTVLLERLQDANASQQQRLDNLAGVESVWRDRVDNLERSLESSRSEASAKKDEVAALARTLVHKNRQVEALEIERDNLRADLLASNQMQRELAAHMASAERDLHSLVGSYCRVQDTLAQQYRDVTACVRERGAHRADPSRSPLWKEPPTAPAPSLSNSGSDKHVSEATDAAAYPHSPSRKPKTSSSPASTPPHPPHISKHFRSSGHTVRFKDDEKKQDDHVAAVAPADTTADEALASAAAAANSALRL